MTQRRLLILTFLSLKCLNLSKGTAKNAFKMNKRGKKDWNLQSLLLGAFKYHFSSDQHGHVIVSLSSLFTEEGGRGGGIFTDNKELTDSPFRKRNRTHFM